MRYKYRISQDGKNIIGLWTDALNGIGEAEVARASDVEYANDIQRWCVTFRCGEFGEASLIQTFPSRREALQAEVKALNSWISAINCTDGEET